MPTTSEHCTSDPRETVVGDEKFPIYLVLPESTLKTVCDPRPVSNKKLTRHHSYEFSMTVRPVPSVRVRL